jgi:cytochrome c oxidase assembly factor 6
MHGKEKSRRSSSRESRDSREMGDGIPLRGQRQVCYQARDAFFKCCDKNNIENPLRDVGEVQGLCKAEKEKFEKDCISTWVRPMPNQFCNLH